MTHRRRAQVLPALPPSTTTTYTENTPANMVMRGGRLRYLTVPLIDPLPSSSEHQNLERHSASSSIENIAEVSKKSNSNTDVYTNIALGNCFDNIINKSSNLIETPKTSTPLCPLNATCHHKSIQKLIKEEKGTCPIAIPQRTINCSGSADNLNQISGSISGRSSPAHSFSNPNSPPKYLSSGGSLPVTLEDHRFSRAPSPLLQVTQACSSDHRCEV